MRSDKLCDKLAYWYLRLNGFMTVENFILHGDVSIRTEADIYGVRFPFRNELESHGMHDDIPFRDQPSKPLFVIAEVKSSECIINGPWSKSGQKNMQYVLNAIGAFKSNEIIERAANSLYENQIYEDDKLKIQMVAFGSRRNDSYLESYPNLHQFLFKDVLDFMHGRFYGFRLQKKDHQQWDEVGKMLYDAAMCSKEEFIPTISGTAGLRLD